MNRHLLTAILIVISLFIPIACAQDLVITQPSANETQLAEMRDFYVYGIFNGTVTHPGDVRIEVYPGDFVNGTPVRVVQSHVDPLTGITNESVIDSSYPNGSRWGGAMVPDLIKSPGDILDPTNKVVVTSRYYLGLIQGGVTKDFDTSYMNGNGTLLTDLTAGNYTIEVTGLSGTCAGEKVNKTITLGLTDAVLGSFRPDSTKNALIQYGITHNRRSYFDWFPGYFYDPDNPGSMGYRADRRWIPNNGIEVVNDRPGTLIDTTTVANNTMFIYNFNSGAATYYLELASILKYNLADSANTTFLYYTNGEPVLTYNDSSGAPQQVTSALKQFSGDSRLALTRLEVRNPDGTSYENLYDPNDTTWKWVYTNLSGRISINQGQAFTIYGVTKPIPSTVSSTSIPYKYSIDNRTSQLVCNITDTYGNLVSTSTHEVNLSRYFNNYPGSRNPYQKFNSLFEFGSEFTTLTLPGTYTVTLTGTDVSGTFVTGTRSTFNVTVVPVASPEGGGDSSDTSSNNPLVVVKNGARAGGTVLFTFTAPVPTGNVMVQSVTLYPSSDTGEVQCIVQQVTPGTPLLITNRDVAGYESITMNWINSGAIDHADISFAVNRTWLTEHSLTPEDVLMLRYMDNRWIELPTKLDRFDGDAFYYIASTPDFPYFAIAGKVNLAGSAVNGIVTVTKTEKVAVPESTSAVVISNPVTVVPTVLLTAAPTPVPTPVVSPAQSFIKDIFFPSVGMPSLTIVVWSVIIIVLIIAAFLIRKWWIHR